MYTFLIDLRQSQCQRINTGQSYPKRYTQLYAMGYKDEAYFIFHCCIPDILDKLLLLRFSPSCQDEKYFKKPNWISAQFPPLKMGESQFFLLNIYLCL